MASLVPTIHLSYRKNAGRHDEIDATDAVPFPYLTENIYDILSIFFSPKSIIGLNLDNFRDWNIRNCDFEFLIVFLLNIQSYPDEFRFLSDI